MEKKKREEEERKLKEKERKRKEKEEKELEDKNMIKELNNENAKLKRDLNNNKTLIEKLKTEKERQEKNN